MHCRPLVALLALLCWMVASFSPVHAEGLAVPNMVTVVDLSVAWCGPCKAMRPMLEALRTELSGRAAVVIVDHERDPAARKAYQTRAYPTLVFHDATGKERYRQMGMMSREQIVAILNKLGMPDAVIQAPTAKGPGPSSKNYLKME